MPFSSVKCVRCCKTESLQQHIIGNPAYLTCKKQVIFTKIRDSRPNDPTGLWLDPNEEGIFEARDGFSLKPRGIQSSPWIVQPGNVCVKTEPRLGNSWPAVEGADMQRLLGQETRTVATFTAAASGDQPKSSTYPFSNSTQNSVML